MKIDKMYAFIATDETGEGLVAFPGPVGMLPMVGGDLDKVEQFMGIAQQISNTSGRVITVAEFSVRTDKDIIYPEAT